MTVDQIGAQAKVGIDIDAKGSQQVVVLLLVLSGIFGIAAAVFMWHRHELWGWLGVATAALVTSAIWCHAKSRPYLDRSAAHPTKFTTSDRGVVVETDALTLADPEAAAALERMMAAAFYRKVLPAPDGRLAADRQIDRSAIAIQEASEEIAQANTQAISGRQRIVDLMMGATGKQGGEIEQPAVVEPPPNVSSRPFSSTTAMPSASGAE